MGHTTKAIGLAALVGAVAVLAALAVPSTASAASGQVTTITETGGQDAPDRVDTSTTDGFSTSMANGKGRFCSSWHWQKAGYDLFGVKQWSETNHYNWCYVYGGTIYFRSGFDTQYTAPFWSVVRHNWGKTWIVPNIKAVANATATFHFSAGPAGQTSSVGVCRWEGNKGGTGNC